MPMSSGDIKYIFSLHLLIKLPKINALLWHHRSEGGQPNRGGGPKRKFRVRLDPAQYYEDLKVGPFLKLFLFLIITIH